MTHVTGVPLIDVTRARDGRIWNCRHMRHYMPPRRPSGRGKVILNSMHTATPEADDRFAIRFAPVAISKMEQGFAYIENKSAGMESAMTFKQGVSGNPHGNRHRTRHLLNQEFMQALLLNFRHQGKKAIEKVARNQPAVYLKILALLVPRETKVEHSQGVKAMSDEQIEAAIEIIQGMLEARAGDQVSVIEATAEPVPALPAPTRKARHKANGTMGEGMCGGDGESNS
jgi:hypothetical protein